jgi:hypothetical protein
MRTPVIGGTDDSRNHAPAARPCGLLCPQRDSNPRYHLERVAT